MDVDGEVVCRTKLLKRGLSFNRRSCVAASHLSQHPLPGPHCSFPHKHTQIHKHSAPVATPSSCSCFFSFFSLSHHSRFLTVSFFSLLFSQYSPSFCFVLYRLFFHNKFRQHNSQSAFLFFCYLYAQVRNILATVVLFFVFYFDQKVKSKHFDTKNVSSEKKTIKKLFLSYFGRYLISVQLRKHNFCIRLTCFNKKNKNKTVNKK